MGDVETLEDLTTFAVDHLALSAHDIVILQDVLAHLEVLRLYLSLRGFDRVGDHLRFDRHIVRDAGSTKESLHQHGIEATHQVVFEREIETRLTRIALTTGSTSQLVVDTTRLMTFGTEDIEPA